MTEMELREGWKQDANLRCGAPPGRSYDCT